MWHGTCMGSQREPNPERQRYRAADRASRKCPQGLGTPYKAMGLGGMLWILPRVQGCKGGLFTQPHTGVNLERTVEGLRPSMEYRGPEGAS